MIVLIRPDADTDTVAGLIASVRDMGLEVTPLDLAKGSAFEVRGPDRGRVLELRGAPGVEGILTRRTALVGGEPLWPHFTLRLGVLALALLVVLFLLTAFFPPGLGDKAQSGAAPAEVFEAYLRPLAGFLALFPHGLVFLGGFVVLLLWVAFLLWPFLDRADAATVGGRRAILLIRVMAVALILLFLLSALGPVA